MLIGGCPCSRYGAATEIFVPETTLAFAEDVAVAEISLLSGGDSLLENRTTGLS
ncbi:hypothetical protein ACQEV9_00850 [Streptomyces chartreusis]|uniref:hypothetical protein n=1 Tax=Streptomyces chartreusis TaxID=1969 RepID=UPI003D8CC1F1